MSEVTAGKNTECSAGPTFVCHSTCGVTVCVIATRGAGFVAGRLPNHLSYTLPTVEQPASKNNDAPSAHPRCRSRRKKSLMRLAALHILENNDAPSAHQRYPTLIWPR